MISETGYYRDRWEVVKKNHHTPKGKAGNRWKVEAVLVLGSFRNFPGESAAFSAYFRGGNDGSRRKNL